jgi:ATP-dependent protease Clp ATPase subunit
MAALGIDRRRSSDLTSRNALAKQYQKIFEYEEVRLSFDAEALRRSPGSRSTKIGARGLRLIMERHARPDVPASVHERCEGMPHLQEVV